MSAGEDRHSRTCFYLLDDQRSADLDSFRQALQAIGELACNVGDGEEREARADGNNLHALFQQLALRLSSITLEGRLDYVWLDKPVQPGPGIKTEFDVPVRADGAPLFHLPALLRGAEAISKHLEMTPAEVMHRHKEGSLPTFRVGGTPFATVHGLDDWRVLHLAGAIPTE